MKLKSSQLIGFGPVALLWGPPLVAGLVGFAMAAANRAEWEALWQHPQLVPALFLSLWTGSVGAAAAFIAAVIITMGLYGTPLWHRLSALAGASLALPHLAFAIGFAFLIMPSGLLSRLLAGGEQPPQWVTTQDPWGLTLIACLAMKETPFLLLLIWNQLARSDVASSLGLQWRAARSLGHGKGSVWLRVLLPQLLPALTGPLTAVWVYGATVVDMALVIGPTQPPTLAVIAWADLNNAEQAINFRGIAAVLVLTIGLAGIGSGVWLAWRGLEGVYRGFMTHGPSLLRMPAGPAFFLYGLFAVIYLLVIFMMFIMSLAGHWPYPQLAPELLQTAAWRRLFTDPGPLILSLVLALTTSAAAISAAVLWLETMDRGLDRYLRAAAFLCLALPALAIAGGQYQMFLRAGLTATFAGLWFAHFTMVFAYVFVVLEGPWRGFDPRWRSVGHGLNAKRLRFLLHLKMPLLKAPLLMAAAIGFSVSMVQFIPAQLMAAGRFATLPMEAVTLASGGNRGLTASYALALTVGPAAAFLAAHLLSRPRWGHGWA